MPTIKFSLNSDQTVTCVKCKEQIGQNDVEKHVSIVHPTATSVSVDTTINHN